MFWVLFCYQTQDFIKITHWVQGRMLMNKFHCIPHYLDVFIIIYSCPINRTPHKYCKYWGRISSTCWHHCWAHLVTLASPGPRHWLFYCSSNPLWQSKCHPNCPQWHLPWAYQAYWDRLSLCSSSLTIGYFAAPFSVFSRPVSWHIHQTYASRSFPWSYFQTQIGVSSPNMSLRGDVRI